jgi:hypothetical protein
MRVHIVTCYEPRGAFVLLAKAAVAEQLPSCVYILLRVTNPEDEQCACPVKR